MLNRTLLFVLVGSGLLVLATYAATRALIITQAPKAVMSKIQERIVQGVGGWNSCYHNQVYGPRKAAARRANPDSIISSMAYDLSDGPVRISGEIWPRYWSLSIYQQNSDNVFVINDRQLGTERFEFILALEGQETSAMSGTPILSPTAKGIMLIRRFAAGPEDMPAILENQNAMYCGPSAETS